MEKKKTGISYVFQLAKDERKKLHFSNEKYTSSSTSSITNFSPIKDIKSNILFSEKG